MFVLKYVNQLKITYTMEKFSRARRFKMVIFLQKKSKTNLKIRPIFFYGALLSRHTVTIGPAVKPIILGY